MVKLPVAAPPAMTTVPNVLLLPESCSAAPLVNVMVELAAEKLNPEFVRFSVFAPEPIIVTELVPSVTALVSEVLLVFSVPTVTAYPALSIEPLSTSTLPPATSSSWAVFCAAQAIRLQPTLPTQLFLLVLALQLCKAAANQ